MTSQPHPEPPLTRTRLALVVAGAAMALGQVAFALAIAPVITGPGDAHIGVLFALWAGCVFWSAAAALMLVRHADIPDVATAAMIVAVPACGAFALSGAYDVRNTQHGTNLSDALMLGVTGGGLTAMASFGIAILAARILRLPRTLEDDENVGT